MTETNLGQQCEARAQKIMQGYIQRISFLAWAPIAIWAFILAGAIPIMFLIDSCGAICGNWFLLAFYLLLGSPLMLPYAVAISRENRVEFSISSSPSGVSSYNMESTKPTLFFIDRKGREHVIPFIRAKLTNQGNVKLILGRLKYLTIRFDTSDQAEDLISQLYMNSKNFQTFEGSGKILRLDYVIAPIIVPLVLFAGLLYQRAPENAASSSFPIVLALILAILVYVTLFLTLYLVTRAKRWLFKVVGNQIIADTMEERSFASMKLGLNQRFTFDISSIRITDGGVVSLLSGGSLLRIFSSNDDSSFELKWFSEIKSATS